MAKTAGQLAVSGFTLEAASVLTVGGVLDSRTYLQLRNRIIEAALDVPRSVLVDVNGLHVLASTAWSVFTSAQWHVRSWPGVPIMLVCADPGRRTTIARTGVTRFVPVHATIAAALGAPAAGRRARRQIRAKLPASLASLRRARELVAEWLAAWSHVELIPVATVVVNVFIENVLQHTAGSPTLVLESDGATITIAVQDDSSQPAARHEDACRGGDRLSGLAIVASVCRAWGSTPMPSGKVVWAIIGPENQL
jgi:anti-anti-sigma factor